MTDERGCGGAVLDLSEEDGETDSSGTVIVTSMDGAAVDSETAFPPPPEDTVDTSTLHRQREPLSDHRRPMSECESFLWIKSTRTLSEKWALTEQVYVALSENKREDI